jgi:ATP-dependent 26S proteasome regulatory subunit
MPVSSSDDDSDELPNLFDDSSRLEAKEKEKGKDALVRKVGALKRVATESFEKSAKEKKIHEKVTGDAEKLIGSLPPELANLTKILTHTWRAEKLGVKIPNVLLIGEPGTGKTHFARHLSRECGVKMVSSPLSAIYGDSAAGSDIRHMNRLWESAAGGILFLDEFDAISSRETLASSSNVWFSHDITHLLSLLDGVPSADSSVKRPKMVLAATNNPKAIDPALLRQGRFDFIVKLPLADHETRAKLLEHYASPTRYDLDIDFFEIAGRLEDWSHADVSSLPRAAAFEAFFDLADYIAEKHFSRAIHKVVEKRRLMNECSLHNSLHNKANKPK